MLIFAGLGFKIAAVPFHFYAPDVYQGTTNANAGLLSVLPKIGRLRGPGPPGGADHARRPGLYAFAWRIAMALAVLTMTFGNVMALWQDNVRRLLAYSSIAHAGYMLIGLAVGAGRRRRGEPGSWDGLGALLLYLASTPWPRSAPSPRWPTWAGGDRQVDGVEELAGLGRTRPLLAAMAWRSFMFSLAGIPPLAGFWGKLATSSAARSASAWPRRRRRRGHLVHRPGRGRRVERRRGRGLLPADRGRDVLPPAAGHAAAPRRHGGVDGHDALRRPDRADRRLARPAVPRSRTAQAGLPAPAAAQDNLHQAAEGYRSWPEYEPVQRSWPGCWRPRPSRSTCSTTSARSSSATGPASSGSASRPKSCWAAAAPIIPAPR